MGLALLFTACRQQTSPDFTISLNPTSLTVQQGQSGQTTLTLTPQNGFTGTVTLVLEDQNGNPAPSGITLSPTSVTVSGSSPVNQALTLSVGGSVATGTYNLRVKATSGSLVKTANLTLTVTAPPGITWTARNSGMGTSLHAVTYGNGLFVAVGDGGTTLTSEDGITWTPRTSGTSNDLYGVTYGNGLFVAVGKYGTILTSP
jgi:hypothetical protein